MAESSLSFPALRGVQAGRIFYVAMCPLRVIPKIFVFNELEVAPELRAQRVLNKARIPEIASYLIANANSYVLSALTASVDAVVDFQPFAATGSAQNLGVLSIPMDAQILINDGQHRRAAIEEAVQQHGALGHDNIPVVLFVDSGLQRSQQMFADLNKYAVRPSSSLATLYDHRDPTAELARHLASECAPFRDLTELEKSAISNRSIKLFTLSGIKHASRALLRKRARSPVTNQDKVVAQTYWEAVAEQIPDWQRARNNEVSSADLREQFIHAHAVALHALGIVGATLLGQYETSWQRHLRGLRQLDWSRSNAELWEGRALVNGRISKATANLQLTACLIKKCIGIRLSPEETRLEEDRRQ